MNELKQIKGVFVKPKKRFYLGRLNFGTPYFYPIGFDEKVVRIRRLILTPEDELKQMPNDFVRKSKKFKNLPMVRRNKYWIVKLLKQYYYISIGTPIRIYWHGLGWKSKWDSPRYEWAPAFYIFFFKWQFCIWWNAPDNNNDLYYEMILWWLNYSDKDIDKAKKTWGWVDMKTNKSTWNDKYSIK